MLPLAVWVGSPISTSIHLPSFHTNLDLDKYLTYLQEQDRLIEQNLMPRIFASALQRLPNCTKLTLADTHLPWSADRLAARVGADLDRGFDSRSSESDRFLRYLWRTMLESAASCGTAPRK